MKKSNLYTRTGDSGQTSLVGGRRADKDCARLEAYGTIDELNAAIGLTHAATSDPEAARTLIQIQHRLFDIGAYLACPPDSSISLSPGVDEAEITDIERAIDALDSRLPNLNSFVLPGGCDASARAHLARTVCRRAERRILTLAHSAPVDPIVISYINRLSDYLFALARFNNVDNGVDELLWQKDR